MTQYLVTTFKDSTGRKHTHITKAKSNQRFTVVEAESKEEAKEKYEARNAPVDGATNLNDIKSNIGIFHVEKVEPNEGMVDINIETMKPFEEADDD
ncbi:TPA: DUF1381 domain-containing protein [Staphylococcus aureus]|uniref:ORF056 n=6 Tax=root TaxID=1 RepID=Q4ZAJ0_9CAUD|nr:MULTISPECIES: DUF1381 domain-containing protein [Staphylococcus]YP_240736.1 transcriptional regulator [Staphylococcus phage 88]YP_240810.1 transcriptional regulator [Staphylococcus phage 92]EWC66215.1 hypothetical protein W893_06470 [Staphylococcus aureus subsp. aureus ST 1413]MBN4912359.1 DUF1381 domain-containing protein [Staphylococcus sp. EG-SA-13]MBN4916556.1 DUF1381 domain-containing protein [Staphylococcus sp. EG-SA-23]MRF34275.1 DUF1381 domain-containing protein [Staphylococcus sp.